MVETTIDYPDEYTKIFDKLQQTYTANYCEENVYMLCKEFLKQIDNKQLDPKNDQAFAIFITNPFQNTSIRYQKLGPDKINFYLVNWDYHVIFMHRQTRIVIGQENQIRKQYSYIYDFDTRLDWPCKFEEYCQKSFMFPKELETFLRMVPADKFICHFASDRSHMIKTNKYGHQNYISPPPSYDAIINQKGDVNNLSRYLDCENKDSDFGMPYMKDKNVFSLFRSSSKQIK